MQSSNRRLGGLLGLGAAAMLAAGLGSAPAGASDRTTATSSRADSASQQKSPPSQARQATKAMSLRELFKVSGRSGWTYPRPGHSVRQGQRMAAKRRNRARNKAAHRGAR